MHVRYIVRCLVLDMLNNISYYSLPTFGRHSWLPITLSSLLRDHSFIRAFSCSVPASGDEWMKASLLVAVLFPFATNWLEVSMWVCSGLWDFMEVNWGLLGKIFLPYKKQVQGDMYPSPLPGPSSPALDVLVWWCVVPAALLESQGDGCQQPRLAEWGDGQSLNLRWHHRATELPGHWPTKPRTTYL